MIINIPTLIAYTATLFAVMTALFFAFWLKEGRVRWLLWYSLPFLLAFGASLLLVKPLAPPLPGLWAPRLAALMILLAYGFVWQAVRAFYGRRSVAWAVLLCVTPWLLFSIFAVSGAPSAVSSSMRAALIALFNGLAAHEFKRSGAEALPSRPILCWVFAAFAVFAALRIPITAFLPAPLGIAPTTAWSVILYNLEAITQALLVTAFMIALSRERLALQNYRLAVYDALTGVLNRRAFDEQADRMVQAAGDKGEPLTLMLFDLDHFKTINDRFGHDIGDKVIQHAADTARRVLRREDRVFRIGGEEFVCLLPSSPGNQAFLIAERLRQAFQADESVAGGAVHATLSIGLASTETPQRHVRNLLARADIALYEAKRTGRNRTVLSGATAGSAAQTMEAP